MHRVDFKKRKKLILRIVSYSLISVLTVITTTLLIYAALGYRVSRNGQVVRSGLLLVDSKPVSAQVFLNGENKNDETESRFVLPTGKYALELKRTGYREWSKQITLAASSVENVHYPLLIPEKLQPKTLLSSNSPTWVSQSPDRKQVLTYGQPASELLLTTLDSEKPIVSALNVPSGFARGTLQVLEWSTNNRFVLIYQKSSNRLLRIDVEKPQDSIDVSAALNVTPSDMHFRGDETNSLYGLEKNSLRVYDIERRSSEVLLKNVVQYHPYNEDTLSFVRLGQKDKQLEAGIYQDNHAVIVHKSAVAKGSPLTRYDKYDGAFFLALYLPGESKVMIYRNPMSAPILDDQLPYATLPVSSTQQLTFSENSQFILAKAGNKVAVYDLLYDRRHGFSVPKNTQSLTWLDSHHLLLQDSKKKTTLMDFDGGNRYPLTTTSVGPVLFSNDYETTYRYFTQNNKMNLQAMDMVVAD